MPSLPDPQTVVTDPNDLDDQDLLGLYELWREPRYLAELVQRYHGLVVSVVRRNLHDSHDIQDGVQATFLILVKSASKIRNRGSLAAWLHGVAYRTARRIRDRTQRDRVLHTSTNEAEELIAIEETPLSLVTKKIQLDVLDEELQVLRESYRGVLVEHYLRGKTAAEIATTFNVSQSTVEGRLRRGRQQLRLQMLRRGFGFSAAVAVSSQWLQAQSASATELATMVEQVVAFSSPSGTDTPSSVSNLIAEEASMSSLISSKLSVAILMGAMTTAALGLLAMTAVGEQTGGAPPTKLTVEGQRAESAATVIAPRGTQSAVVALPNSAIVAASQPQAWPSPATDRARQALRHVVLDVAYNSMPLQQVLEGLADDMNIAIHVDSAALQEMGTDIHEPVTLNLTPIPFSQVLDYLLSPLDLSYRVEGGVLFISSRDKLDHRPNLRVYDYSVFETPGIAAVIEQHIRKIQPDLWVDSRWSIDQLDDHLMFVSASDPAHTEIELLLTDLARQLGKPLPQPVAEPTTATQPKKTAPSTTPSPDPFGTIPSGASDNPFGN